MAWSSAAPTRAPTCKKNKKHYISRTGLGHVETGICFPEPKFEAQCQQKQVEIDNSYYNAETFVSATTTFATNSKNQSSSFQNNPCLDDSQLTQLFESILNKLHTDQPASNPGASFNSEQASAFADHMHISDSGGKIYFFFEHPRSSMSFSSFLCYTYVIKFPHNLLFTCTPINSWLVPFCLWLYLHTIFLLYEGSFCATIPGPSSSKVKTLQHVLIKTRNVPENSSSSTVNRIAGDQSSRKARQPSTSGVIDCLASW